MTDLTIDKQNLTYLEWTRNRHSSGTAGSFLKATSVLNGSKTYYKLSNYDPILGIIGHESINEIIVDRLLNLLGIDHVHYDLIHADILVNDKLLETYLCSSDNFRKRGESKVALDVYYELEKLENESPLEFCIRIGFEKYIYEMLLVDFLIMNRDRHGANIEVLRDSKHRTIRPAPLFDHGLSLLAPCHNDDDFRAFDVMADKPIQSFVGSRSAYENFKLIPHSKLPEIHPLKEADKSLLFEGLQGVISEVLEEQIWSMIWRRWCYYEDFCNKR